MSDPGASDPGAAPGSNTRRARILGQRSEKSQSRRDAAIKATKETWGVSDYAEIFPANIRPERELGDSAVLNIRRIAIKVPQLAEAQLLMTNECIDTGGRPITLCFTHTSNILVHLKEAEAKAAEDKKNEEATKASGSSMTNSSTKDLAIEKRLAAGLHSVPTSGSAGAKAAGQINSLAANKTSAPGKRSTPGDAVVPAKNSLSGNASRLSRVKAPIPVSHLIQGGSPVSKTGHTSLMGDKSGNKEMTSGLHAPTAKDVAPFSGNRLVAFKKPIPKVRDSLQSEEDNAILENPSLSVAEGDAPGALVKNDQGLSANLNTKENCTSVKRRSDDADELPFKKIKFSKESLLAELNFVKRGSQKDGSLITDQTPSEEDTDIDIESVPKLLGDNVAIKYGFGEHGEKEATGKGGERKPHRDTAAGIEIHKSANRPKHIKQAYRALAYNPGDIHPYATPSLTMSTAKEDVQKKGKAHGGNLDTPTSPKNSPDREENINSDLGRRLSDFQTFKRAKTTSSFSPTGEVPTNSTLSLDNKTSNLSTKINHSSSIPKKDIMEYTVNEASNKAEELSTTSSKEDDPQLTPKAAVTPARGITFSTSTSSAIPRKPNTILPELPETLTARIPADRALIVSVPGILKAYIKELRAAIPDGKGPDGDLLSMIIVNKYGYFLEHVDKLDKDLKSLYYEAIDKDNEREAKEREDKERSL